MHKHHANLAAKILASPDPKRRFGTATNQAQTREKRPGDTRSLYRKAHLDLGASAADRNWHVANPGKIDPDSDSDYRDALGPIKGSDGCTVKTLDYRRYR
jgi:hypothetical protein